MTRLTANLRMQRLLAIVPWVAAHDGPRIDDVCERFGLTRSELLADLDIVFMVGLYPFTPDELIDVTMDDERVWIRYADVFSRPLRLRPDEGLALVAAGVGLLAVPGADADGPLGRGLAKIAAVLGINPAEAVEVDLGIAHGPTFELLSQAVGEGRQVELDYYTFGRDERSHRTVDPWRVYTDQGHWYLEAWCHQAGADRVFRIDRIGGAVLLADAITHQPENTDRTSPTRYEGGANDPRVDLAVNASARWVADAYPVDQLVEQADGGLLITLPVAGQAWLERLLLRLGPDARLVRADPPLDASTLAADAAVRVLSRYR